MTDERWMRYVPRRFDTAEEIGALNVIMRRYVYALVDDDIRDYRDDAIAARSMPIVTQGDYERIVDDVFGHVFDIMRSDGWMRLCDDARCIVRDTIDSMAVAEANR